jgi:hypothetical protein
VVDALPVVPYYRNDPWIEWSTSSATTTYPSTTNGNDAWQVWTTAGTTASVTTWGQWVVEMPSGRSRRVQREEYLRPRARPTLTDAQLAAQEAAVAERVEANRRADELLLSCLDEEQQAELAAQDRFHVTAPSGRRYVIRRGYAGNVDSPEEGLRFCIHGPGELPTADHMLAQKLLLETDETGFRNVANISHIARESRAAAA